MSASDIDRARTILVQTPAKDLHTIIEHVSLIKDAEELSREYEGMRAELRGYGMESDVAAEVINQFAGLVYAYRHSVQ